MHLLHTCTVCFFQCICVPGISLEDCSWFSVVLKLTNKISLACCCTDSGWLLRVCLLQFLPVSKMSVTQQGEILLPSMFCCCCILLLCCHCKLCTAKTWPLSAEPDDFSVIPSADNQQALPVFTEKLHRRRKKCWCSDSASVCVSISVYCLTRSLFGSSGLTLQMRSKKKQKSLLRSYQFFIYLCKLGEH